MLRSLVTETKYNKEPVCFLALFFRAPLGDIRGSACVRYGMNKKGHILVNLGQFKDEIPINSMLIQSL